LNSTAIIINIMALAGIVWAFLANRQKALVGIKKGVAVLASIAPVTLLVVAGVSILLAFVPPATISAVPGESSGLKGILTALGLGSLVHMPALLGFPIAGKLLTNGGAAGPIAAFITSLTMIGIFTIPMEIKIMGKRFAIARNLASAGLALVIAIIIGVLV
jgi:uncharacterized membrane protein YraQ (UPF0718 family)